ncbi:hypothetical protein MKW92_023436 [Papaver armeniacum]|nr:hypothetical protein MKW92_023436 [Papaver armeniacum]
MQVWQNLMEAEILSALAPVDSFQPGKHRAGETHGFPWWGYLIIGILVVLFFVLLIVCWRVVRAQRAAMGTPPRAGGGAPWPTWRPYRVPV